MMSLLIHFFKIFKIHNIRNKIKVNVSSRKFTSVIWSLCAPGTQLLLSYPLLVGAPWVEWPLCQHLPDVALVELLC